MTSPRDIVNRIPISIAMMIATLMNTLDSTIANVALPHIQGSLSASQDQITWVLTSYIIATAIMTPLSGWLSQKFGRKNMFLISIVGFTAASMLCGIATSLPEMVAFRLLQGIAGSTMMPLSQTVMLDIFPPRQIPTVMAVWSSAVIVGPILGPALGGWLTENSSWRWCFYINAPLGVLSFLILFLFMDTDHGGRQRPFDFLGFGALVMFVGGLQLMFDRGPNLDWFDAKEIWFEAMFAAIGLYVFIVQTITSKDPFFHRDLAKDRNFMGATVFGFVVGMLMFSVTALLPTLMQNLLGYSVLQSGYASMPRGVGSMAAFLLVPFLMRLIGPRRVLMIGLAISGIAMWLMSRFDLSMTVNPILISGLIQGVGTGLLFAPMTTLAYVTLNPAHRAEGTTVATMARSLGASIGISFMQASLIRGGAAAHSVLAEHLQLSDPVVRWALPSFMNPQTDTGIAVLNSEVTRQATMIAYDQVFGFILLTTLAMAPLLLLMRPPTAQVELELEAAH